jgi:hypothetical protein
MMPSAAAVTVCVVALLAFTAHNVTMRGSGIRQFLEALKRLLDATTTIDGKSSGACRSRVTQGSAERHRRGARIDRCDGGLLAGVFVRLERDQPQLVLVEHLLVTDVDG